MIADLTREELLVLIRSQAQVIKELREENTRLLKTSGARGYMRTKKSGSLRYA